MCSVNVVCSSKYKIYISQDKFWSSRVKINIAMLISVLTDQNHQKETITSEAIKCSTVEDLKNKYSFD